MSSSPIEPENIAPVRDYSARHLPEVDDGCFWSAAMCGVARDRHQNQVRNFSIDRNVLLFSLLKLSGLYHTPNPEGWHALLAGTYPLFINGLWLFNISYLVIWDRPNLTLVWVVYYILAIIVFWYTRWHLMRSFFNCNSVDNNHISNRSIRLAPRDRKKVNWADLNIGLILLVMGGLFLAQGVVILQETYHRNPPQTALEWTRFIVSRIGSFYFYLTTLAIYSYVCYHQMINYLEIRALRGRLQAGNYSPEQVVRTLTEPQSEDALSRADQAGSDHFRLEHLNIMIKMLQTSRELSLVIFAAMSTLLSRIPIGLFEFNKTRDNTELVWMVVNLILFGYMCWQIAVVNRASVRLPCFLHSERIFNRLTRTELTEYLERNPAYSMVFGYPLTERDLLTFYTLLANLIVPIIYSILIT